MKAVAIVDGQGHRLDVGIGVWRIGGHGQAGRLDVSPLVTHEMPMTQMIEAFEHASDRETAIKVQLKFGDDS